MLEKILGAIFGTKNERELKRLWALVSDISASYEALKDHAPAD